ncbi:MAG TPA: DNA polymerase [Aridibacter sp.]|nr:DNA polymerase [Aridibacter sp.]
MEIYFQLIEEPEKLREACGRLSGEKFLGFDTETSELEPRDGILRLVQLSNGRDTIVVDLFKFDKFGDLKEIEELEPLREILKAKRPVKIAHNSKFDAKWVGHHLGIDVGGTFDTMIASQLISAGDQDRRHSLADVAAFFLGTEVDKAEQVSDWTAETLSDSQIEYAAKDAAIVVSLREKLAERLRSDGLQRVAEIEFGCVTAIARMELNGFHIDKDCWRQQLSKVKGEQESIAFELQEMLSAGVAQASLFGAAQINLDSQAQVSDALRNLGVPLPDSTRAWQLQPLAKDYPVIGKLLEYRGVAKALTSFGENILEFVDPRTGRIHADFRQIGAPTGRFSCSKPNLQQIPHGPEYRRCFRAEKGNTLVVADYSQIELRILAEFSGDEKFIDAFRSGEDFHASAAAQVFGVPPSEVTADQRSFAKRLNFGVVYGIGAQRLATITGFSEREAENVLRRYFATYRGLDEWLRAAGERAVSDRAGRTASGRLARFRFDEEDRAQIGSTKRNGKNMPIQGTSADILKRALALLHDAIKGSTAILVNIVHDEIVVECSEAEAEVTSKRLKDSMTAAAEEFIKRVPVVVDVSVSDEWGK